MTAPLAHLIVNADDYGYFECVNQGILEAARLGRITATGLLANAAGFETALPALRSVPTLDLGVHLNLTDGRPLSSAMAAALRPWDGRFPGKFTVARAVLSGRLPLDAVEREWRAQIERCLEHDLTLRFLNSHEHLHMLPPLLRLTHRLAHAYGIASVRLTAPDSWPRTPGGLIRDGAMALFSSLAHLGKRSPAPRFLGLGPSGRLDTDSLVRRLARLKPGEVYELMCHPGRCRPEQVARPELLRYHDWKGEFRALTGPEFGAALERHGVRLVGYRQLEIRDGRLQVRPDPVPHSPGGTTP